VVEWAVFSNSLLDGIFLGVLTLGTGGYNTALYWLFLALIARTAVSVPRSTSQLLLNLTLSTCYVVAGLIDTMIANRLEPWERAVLELYTATDPAEPLLLRLALLLLMTFGCYAIQVLLERQRQVEEEAREFAVREVQLRSAGRLAAEFAHQIKNPLAIINNAAFSLQKALKEGKRASEQQIAMIQEEVDRADRIITQVMGYAQLSEGHVEKLNVLDELDHAIERVFPPAAGYPIQVHRSYREDIPPLLMQKRHVSETFINVLQNAREVLAATGGNVFVLAECHPDQTIVVAIRDDGPGIAPDKHSRIFEAYYTTKERGTGLGLATVKHNIELYGGTIRVESELGKGACFRLIFPAKSLMP
jgi:signal transduction histidine kinase